MPPKKQPPPAAANKKADQKKKEKIIEVSLRSAREAWLGGREVVAKGLSGVARRSPLTLRLGRREASGEGPVGLWKAFRCSFARLALTPHQWRA
uniref:Uncharacterized protein n=1 Tax=Sphaerodactylus townsendi TaxID=933632 RepID=A0ACB8FZP8_9SAUR